MSSEPKDRGYVVVTGTSTGIGAATALHLADKGFHVFTGFRRKADGEALRAQVPELLTPLVIEVTDGATIRAAAASLSDVVGERGDFEDQARSFVDEIADKVLHRSEAASAGSPTTADSQRAT
jgi:NAD(P)-dependent dehydrogenase (short-subunit alcohol dehydrogenase family)